MTSVPESKFMIEISEDGYFSETQTAKYLNLSKKSLQRWRFNRQGPPYVKLNGKTIRYRREDLDQWMKDRLVSTG